MRVHRVPRGKLRSCISRELLGPRHGEWLLVLGCCGHPAAAGMIRGAREVQALEVRRLLVEQPSGHYLSPRGRGVSLQPSRLVEYHQAQVEVREQVLELVLELVLAVAESDRPRGGI